MEIILLKRVRGIVITIYTYKCPNCSGGLNFNPETQDLNCEFCGSHFNKEEMESKKPQNIEPEEIPHNDTAFYSCSGCGAEVMTDCTTVATDCFYCHSSVVLSDRLTGAFRPDEVIPFTIQKDQAKAGLVDWINKKWFVPKGFSCARQIDTITGVYFPVWYADCELSASFKTEATKVRTWEDKEFRYKETRSFNVEREGDIALKNIPKAALDKEESQLYKSVLPFDESKAVKFTTAYLSGFQAEKRNIDSTTWKDEIKEDAKKYSTQLFKDSASDYNTFNRDSLTVNNLDTNWKYTLLPVWTMTYRDSKKTYFYVINGQTGKANGELPINRLKLTLVSILLSVILFFILSFFSVVVGVLFYIMTVSKYRKGTKIPSIDLNHQSQLNLTRSKDQFIDEKVTKTPLPKDSKQSNSGSKGESSGKGNRKS